MWQVFYQFSLNLLKRASFNNKSAKNDVIYRSQLVTFHSIQTNIFGAIYTCKSINILNFKGLNYLNVYNYITSINL